MKLYDRLGPRAKEVIGAAHRVIDIKRCIAAFLATRRPREPIEIDGDFYPAPPHPSIYAPGEGDIAFARWLEENVIYQDVRMFTLELMLDPIREGPVTLQARRLHKALGKQRRFR